MSETVLKILLSELGTLRIVCRKCKTVIEMPVTAFDRRHNKNQNDMNCPGCGDSIRVGRADETHPPLPDGLDSLVKAWEELYAMKNKFDIQFVLRDKGKAE